MKARWMPISTTANRAALTDVADLAVRRMARDLRGALPNSIGPALSNSLCMEFIPHQVRWPLPWPTTAQRAEFNASVTSFNMLGRWARCRPARPLRKMTGWWSTTWVPTAAPMPMCPTMPPESTTLRCSRPATGQTNIRIVATAFPLASGSKRFHVLPAGELAVAYAATPPPRTHWCAAVRKPGPYLVATASPPPDAVLAKNVNRLQFPVQWLGPAAQGLSASSCSSH